MNNITSRSALCMLVAASGVAFATSSNAQECTPKHAFKTVEEGYLTVSAPTFPPFSIPKGENEVSGIDGDIVTAIAEMECLKIKVTKVEYATAVPYVSSGRTDVAIGNYYRTEARAAVVAISDPLYLDEMGIFSRDGISKIEDLKGHSVGTVQGYLWVDELKAILGEDLKLYNNYVALYQDLDTGRIQVAIDGLGVGAAAQQSGSALKGIQLKVAEKDERVQASVNAAQAGLPLSKDNADLLAAVNADLAEIRSSGKLVEILEKSGLQRSAADVGEPRLIK
ncbi:transporter substrate-binding domain-containing protein [Shinella daejeonensis]|uniref:substrate-binding periplasmic protein n=1 Tax=Shinella daejeonensis TaxID=659017 RepID=UPI0020C7D0CB|nr:transporter substrate-binding domain-containing protein [Shinella daejeonensis]MCP8894979.1 transporter substrate-binding domain-containing protein [Shinella daejeonensis]